jgi:glycosyltransferase involved in cell wall biosynthesis
MNTTHRLHLLFVSHEPWPTFRADVAVLFGKYLPRKGVTCDLVTERDAAGADNGADWVAGKAIVCDVPNNRAGQHLVKFWHNLRVLVGCDPAEYDAIQVRDMPLPALLGLIVARRKGLPFFYWMSFPQSEGQILRAKARGARAGLRYWFPLIQGTLGKWLLYRVVLPRSDHIFVQSQQMLEDVAAHGIPPERMTAVPMGVDLESAMPKRILPKEDARLVGKQIAVYLGTLDRARRIELLFEMLAIARQENPDILLVLAGDTEDAAHREWLREEARRLGVAEAVLWTGWLPTHQAWRYVRAAEVGLSPFPRGFLLDSASPTKAIEYMALGIPVIVNDNPDQAQVVRESGAGVCVPLEPEAFARALLELLSDSRRRQTMGEKGRLYVAQARGYDRVAEAVALAYRTLLGGGTKSRTPQGLPS